MPNDRGLDVMNVKFAPRMITNGEEETLTEVLEQTIQSISNEVKKDIFPHDLFLLGKEMAEAYLYLYCVENTLRLFIEKIAKEEWGDAYFDKLNLNQDIKKLLKGRERNEAKNKWLRFRGDSKIFYLDFSDLSSVIRNNWDIFSNYFPDQNWICTKISELAEIRNLVAHNSYIGKKEKDLLKAYFTVILQQLNNTLAST
jgi:hypothetical protein